MVTRGPRKRWGTKKREENKIRRPGGIEPWNWTGMRLQSPDPLLRVGGKDLTFQRPARKGVEDGKGDLAIQSSMMISTTGAGGTNGAAEMPGGVGQGRGRNERGGEMDPAGELGMV